MALAVALLALIASGAWFVQHRRATDPVALFDRARIAFERRDYAAAEVDLRALLARQADNAEARLLLGLSYLERGNAAGALKEFGKARDIGLEDQTIALGTVRAQLMLGKLDDADGEIALHGIAESAEWSVLRGTLAFARGMLDDAQRAYADAVARRPDWREARAGLARVEMARGKPAAARRELETLLGASSKDAGLWVLKGTVELEAREPEAARAAFEQALGVAPDNPLALLGLAEALLLTGDLAAADARLDAIGDAGIDDPRVNLLRARIAEAGKDPARALAALNKVLRVLPDDRTSLAMAARLNFALGAYSRAEEFAVQLLEREPGDESARRLLGAISLAGGRLEDLDALGLTTQAGDDPAGDPAALALLGTAYLRHGRYQDAEAQLSRAASLAPDSAAILTAAALGKLSVGAVDQAVAELRSVVAAQPEFGQARALLVLALMGAKRMDEARDVAQAFVAAAPDNALAHNLLGYQREASGDAAGAELAYRAALAADQDFHVAHVNLARLAIRRGDRAAGQAQFADVRRRDPHNLLALLGLAALALESGEGKRAEELWVEAREHHPDAVQPRVLLSRYYRGNGTPLLAEAPICEAWKLAPYAPAVQLEYADAMLDLGDNAAALEAVKALLVRLPDNVAALERLARASQQAHDTVGLLAALRRITEQNPQHVAAQSTLVRLAVEQQDYAQAERIVRALQGHATTTAVGHELAGDVAVARGDAKTALAAYVRAVELAPSAARLLKLERVERAGGKGSARLAAWLETHPEDQEVRLALATTLQEQGDRDGAIAGYESVLAAVPAQAVALNNLAWLYFEQGDGRALAIGKRAFEAAPREAAVVDTYAWILFQQGQREQGLELLRRAVELAPDNPDIGYHLASALADSGRQDEARKRVRTMLDKHARFALRAEAERLRVRLGDG